MFYLGAKLAQRGHEITFFVNKLPSDLVENENITIIVWDKITKYSWLIFSFIAGLYAIRNAEKYDYIYSNIGYGWSYVFRKTKPFVVHMRTSPITLYKSELKLGKPSIKRRIGSFINIFTSNIALKKADIIFVNSLKTKLCLVKDFKIRNTNNIYIVNNGVSPLFFRRSDKEQIMRRWDNEKNKIAILTVTRLDHSKGIYRIPKFLQLLAQTGINYEYTIIGDGPLYQDIYNLSKMYNLNVMGKVTDEKLISDYYLKSDLYVSFSSPGTSVIEAALFGLPIICFFNEEEENTYGIPLDEMIKKDAIILVKTQEEIIKHIINFTNNKQHYIIKGLNAYNFAQKLSWDNIAKKAESILYDLKNCLL